MAERSSQRHLSTSAGTITFNTRLAAEYFIKSIDGEDGIPVRAPFDNVPHGDGGIPHDFWDEPRHITVKGVITLDPLLTAVQQVTQRNQMEDTLIAVCRGARRVSDTGMWQRERTGMSDQQVSVQVDFQPVFTEEPDGKNFTFGMVAADPDWT